MISIGITGGIGAGKSASAECLRDLGFPLLDTDDAARQVVSPGSEGLRAVVSAFGDRVLRSDGSLDRPALAAVIFADATARKTLESILHPRIHRLWSDWLVQRRSDGSLLTFVVIPLLFEKAYQSGFDRTVAVGCSQATQRNRLRARGWSEAEIDARLGAQLPMEEKLRRAGHGVWNEGDLGCLRDQWLRLVAGWSRPLSKDCAS